MDTSSMIIVFLYVNIDIWLRVFPVCWTVSIILRLVVEDIIMNPKVVVWRVIEIKDFVSIILSGLQGIRGDMKSPRNVIRPGTLTKTSYCILTFTIHFYSWQYGFVGTQLSHCSIRPPSDLGSQRRISS